MGFSESVQQERWVATSAPEVVEHRCTHDGDLVWIFISKMSLHWLLLWWLPAIDGFVPNSVSLVMPWYNVVVMMMMMVTFSFSALVLLRLPWVFLNFPPHKLNFIQFFFFFFFLPNNQRAATHCNWEIIWNQRSTTQCYFNNMTHKHPMCPLPVIFTCRFIFM